MLCDVVIQTLYGTHEGWYIHRDRRIIVIITCAWRSVVLYWTTFDRNDDSSHDGWTTIYGGAYRVLALCSTISRNSNFIKCPAAAAAGRHHKHVNTKTRAAHSMWIFWLLFVIIATLRRGLRLLQRRRHCQCTTRLVGLCVRNHTNVSHSTFATVFLLFCRSTTTRSVLDNIGIFIVQIEDRKKTDNGKRMQI